MMHEQGVSYPAPQNQQFIALVQKCANGFILSVNNVPFVIQGEGKPIDDFDKLLDSLRDAYHLYLRGNK